MGKRSRSLTMGQAAARANRWRDQFNPQRGLTIARAVSLAESYPRGEFSDLMWTFGAPFTGIECSDPDLLALIERRTSAVLEMDWNEKAIADPPKGFSNKQVEDQADYIRESLDAVENLYEAIDHLVMASFRGFAHCEMIEDRDRNVIALEPVDQWNVVRDGSRGRWKYNPTAQQVTFQALPEEMLIEPEFFLIREVKRPVGRIALIKWVRENLSDKDWDAFIEMYGIPGGVVTMPPNVPSGEEDDYLSMAEETAKGGSGALPHGATYTANDQPRGNNPFKERLQWLQEKLILAGTGGKLTMLAESGSGTLAGGAHSEVFAQIARSEARKISEIIQRQLVEPRLRERFPGQPVLAYFELAANEETDTGEFVEDVAKLSQAGLEVEAAQVQEKTGYRVTRVERDEGLPGQPVGFPPARNRGRPLRNREGQSRQAGIVSEAIADALEVAPEWLRPIEEFFQALAGRVGESGKMDEETLAELEKLLTEEAPELLDRIDVDVFAEVVEKALAEAVVEGLEGTAPNLPENGREENEAPMGGPSPEDNS